MKKSIRLTLAGVLLASAGCRDFATTDTAEQVSIAPDSSGAAVAGDDHDHAHGDHAHAAGPHGGTVADWGGGKFHVEFTVDHQQQTATVYVLAGDEKTPAPIDAQSLELSITDPAMQATLMASPQPGDGDGKSSRFVGTHEKLGVVQAYAGTISGVADGTPYAGDFAE